MFSRYNGKQCLEDSEPTPYTLHVLHGTVKLKKYQYLIVTCPDVWVRGEAARPNLKARGPGTRCKYDKLAGGPTVNCIPTLLSLKLGHSLPVE